MILRAADAALAACPLEAILKKIGMIVLCTFGFLVAADLIGVAASFFCDAILDDWRRSTALFYAIWLVLGIFCGMIHYLTCGSVVLPKKEGDFIGWGDKGRIGILVILTTTIILAALTVTFYRLDWRYSRADSVYVPDSEPLTITFFVAVLASAIFTHHTLGPDPIKAKK